MKNKHIVLTSALAIGAVIPLSMTIASFKIVNNDNNSTSNIEVNNIAADLDNTTQCNVIETDSTSASLDFGIIRPSEDSLNFTQLELHSDSLPVYTMEQVNEIIDEGTDEYYNNNGSSLINTDNYIYNVYAIDSTSGASDIDLLEYKSYIYHMMLNSVDYFNNAQGEMVYAMNSDSPIEIEFQTDIDKQCSYECLTQNGEIVEINYVEDNVAYTVDAIDCTYVSYSQGDVIEFSISDNDRFVMLDSGETLAVNRNDLTNLATAGNSCLFPQSYAMSYLSDFSSWNISGMENLCGRDCVIVDGTADGNSFTMWIDVNTGILMKYVDIEGYVQVDSIEIDENIEVNSFSPEMYTKAE